MDDLAMHPEHIPPLNTQTSATSSSQTANSAAIEQTKTVQRSNRETCKTFRQKMGDVEF
jgi:hypothetical protein